MDGLLLAPVDRSAIFFGKAISNLAFMLIVETIVIPLYGLLYNEARIFSGISGCDPARLNWIHRSWDIALSHVSANTHTRCVTAHLLFGRSAGTFGIRQSQRRITGRAEFAEILTPLNLLIVYDVVFIAIAFMVFDFVVEE